MRVLRHAGTAFCALLIAAAQGQSLQGERTPVSRAELCVTEGALGELSDSALAVSVPKMRAYLNRRTDQVAELSFTYLGPTAAESRLGSGANRRQFGIKLRAGNACNLIYVMWRVEPESKLVMSLKANPGQQSSAQCANRGYRDLRASSTAPVPQLVAGSKHQLLAQIQNEQLSAWLDGRLVWRGTLESTAAHLSGPVGIRTDNVQPEFTLLTAPAAPVPPSLPSCRAADSE